MDSIWVVNCSGIIQPQNGWFDTKERCEDECRKLRYKFKYEDVSFKPYEIFKNE